MTLKEQIFTIVGIVVLGFIVMFINVCIDARRSNRVSKTINVKGGKYNG